jgi:hypothetical protein
MGMSLGTAIAKLTTDAPEPFSVRVPQEGSPQYVYDSDPDNPTDVPADIVAQAEAMVAADV